MANESNAPENLSRATDATTRRINVRLDQIAFDPDRYCHRNPEKLTPESLGILMNNLVSDGGMHPHVELFRDEQGKIVLIKGHRRIAASRTLADNNVPGYSRNMEI